MASREVTTKMVRKALTQMRVKTMWMMRTKTKRKTTMKRRCLMPKTPSSTIS